MLAPHQIRVIQERDELRRCHEKLATFIQSALFAGLPGEDRELLQEQEVAMATYLSILNRRIHRFFQS